MILWRLECTVYGYYEHGRRNVQGRHGVVLLVVEDRMISTGVSQAASAMTCSSLRDVTSLSPNR